MKAIRVLQNNNRLCREIASESFYPNQCSDFSMRLVFSGTEHCRIGARKLNIHPGTFLVLNEGTGYSTQIDSNIPVSTFSVFFASKFLKDFHHTYLQQDNTLLDDPFAADQHDTPRFLEALYPLHGDLKFNFLHLKRHFDSNTENELLLNEYLYHCLLLYYKIYQKEVILTSKNLDILNKQTKAEILKRLAIARDYVLSNFNQPLSLEEISKHACLSVNHLLRTFKQAYGCSPHQYLMQVRLARAKFLLKSTLCSVNDVVNMVGFESPSSFIRLFKNNYNVTPGSFRQTKSAATVDSH